MILVNQLAEPGVPRPPLPTGRWGRGHMTQPLPFRQGPGSTGSEVRMGQAANPRALRTSCAKQVCAITGGRNGCLTLANPGEIRLDALKQAGHSIY